MQYNINKLLKKEVHFKYINKFTFIRRLSMLHSNTQLDVSRRVNINFHFLLRACVQGLCKYTLRSFSEYLIFDWHSRRPRDHCSFATHRAQPTVAIK